jgi:heterotetrameric sarcosine oxidase delta subunit
MIQIRCPWCGWRGAAEFQYVGELSVRPDPASTTPLIWRNFLYFPTNPCGPVAETWYHRMGCRQYITIGRDTATNETWAVSDGTL